MPVARKEYEHGEIGRYRRDKCRCQQCRDAFHFQRKLQARRKNLEGAALTPMKPVRKMVHQLHMAGWTYERMGEWTGIHRDTLWRIARADDRSTTHWNTRQAIQRLWDDVFCEGRLHDAGHPRRLRSSRKGPARWDAREILRLIDRRYGHSEALTPEDRYELTSHPRVSTVLAERLAIKHNLMPWEVWPDWDGKVKEDA